MSPSLRSLGPISLAGVLLACGGAKANYSLEPATEKQAYPAAPPFVLFADTQYSLPATDYDLRPTIEGVIILTPAGESAKLAPTFYRHAAANATLPIVLNRVLTDAQTKGAKFAVFAGDLVEFACVGEAERMFDVLRKQPLPVILAPGNHDVLFHGSWDTDAVKQSGGGTWDKRGWELWDYVCKPQGGRLTKPKFIRMLADYYQHAFGITVDTVLQAGEARVSVASCPGPTTATGAPCVEHPTNGPWKLEYGLKLGRGDGRSPLGTGDEPTAHRNSHFWQRWTYSDGVYAGNYTVLDTVDYADREGLCDRAGMLIQLGMSGSMSIDQLEWLQNLPPPSNANAFVLGHYLPFTGIADEDPCSRTAGTSCAWGRGVLEAYAKGAVILYGHVHQDFEEEVLSATNRDPRSEEKWRVIRTPSLIDNKAYVVFDGAQFESERLADEKDLFESEAPFTKPGSTCEQRLREVAELAHSLSCFTGDRPVAPPHGWISVPSCKVTLAQAQAEVASMEGVKDLCSGASLPGLNDAGKCQAPMDEAWRCVLREWIDELLGNLKGTDREAFALRQLQSVKVQRAK